MLSHIFHIRNKLSYILIHKSVKDFEYLAPYLIHITTYLAAIRCSIVILNKAKNTFLIIIHKGGQDFQFAF